MKLMQKKQRFVAEYKITYELFHVIKSKRVCEGIAAALYCTVLYCTAAMYTV